MNFNDNQVFTSDHETMSRDTWHMGERSDSGRSGHPWCEEHRSYAPLTTKEICHNLDLLTTLALTSLLENINLGQTPS